MMEKKMRSTGFGTSSNHSGTCRTFVELLFLRYFFASDHSGKKFLYLCVRGEVEYREIKQTE
ncbi:hypothetical protein X777_16185 [Ooceraea biroi]|uniref:Uncharacterized protein n=1 Tax=Ooceraea biroi TaxID=2015173 RepID=A0A026WVD2_OOCBI|nr:hypothetical protein X777_16185 [Ooceraea biroi]